MYMKLYIHVCAYNVHVYVLYMYMYMIPHALVNPLRMFMHVYTCIYMHMIVYYAYMCHVYSRVCGSGLLYTM